MTRLPRARCEHAVCWRLALGARPRPQGQRHAVRQLPDVQAHCVRQDVCAHPTEVTDFIDHIRPTTTFNNPLSLSFILSVPKPAAAEVSAEMSSDATAASCATTLTPILLQSLYKIPAAESSNSIAVAGFIEQFTRPADLKSFTKFRTNMVSSTTFKTQLLGGGKNSQGASTAGVEANLDIQYIVGIATGVPVFFVSVGESSQDGDLEGFLDIVNFLSDEDDVAQAMSTSSPRSKLCTAYAAFGARGTSVLFASGDGGVEGGQSQTCTKYQAAFPAGCPFPSAVGSVHGTSPEADSTFSSGGFSNYWGVRRRRRVSQGAGHDHQRGPLHCLRPRVGVAAQGENVRIASGGTFFASVTALRNGQLIATGNAPLSSTCDFTGWAGWAGSMPTRRYSTMLPPAAGVKGWDPVCVFRRCHRSLVAYLSIAGSSE
ncbi:peptidase S8/S53 domain-containing protein [Mycena rosella]|uniref:Peptidase S8/S53 domain-containing protein n=1 Tax=Mycena rosella TaxID=1033263 RepID=A0AAD7M7K6_MYCRO|nr:peptidase S8/S53 domain-containing protein [Mycena rosella]